MKLTPSRQARLAAGKSLGTAARRLGVTIRYLRRCESAQAFSLQLASAAARFYGADLTAFLPLPTGAMVPGGAVRQSTARGRSTGAGAPGGRL